MSHVDLTDRERRLLGWIVRYIDEELNEKDDLDPARDDIARQAAAIDATAGVFAALKVYGFANDAAETVTGKLAQAFHNGMWFAREKAIMPEVKEEKKP